MNSAAKLSKATRTEIEATWFNVQSDWPAEKDLTPSDIHRVLATEGSEITLPQVQAWFGLKKKD